jgi:hypothetical protein
MWRRWPISERTRRSLIPMVVHTAFARVVMSDGVVVVLITSDVSVPARTYGSCGSIARQQRCDAGTRVTIYPNGENESELPGVGSCR